MRMQRIRGYWFQEFREKRKMYYAESMRDFIEDRDRVAHGKNGLVVALGGRYRISFDVGEIRLFCFGGDTLGLVLDPDAILPTGSMLQYPYDQDLKTRVLCEEELLSEYNEKVNRESKTLDLSNIMLAYDRTQEESRVLSAGFIIQKPPSSFGGRGGPLKFA